MKFLFFPYLGIVLSLLGFKAKVAWCEYDQIASDEERTERFIHQPYYNKLNKDAQKVVHDHVYKAVKTLQVCEQDPSKTVDVFTLRRSLGHNLPSISWDEAIDWTQLVESEKCLKSLGACWTMIQIPSSEIKQMLNEHSEVITTLEACRAASKKCRHVRSVIYEGDPFVLQIATVRLLRNYCCL
eukprot:Platyproteum_vivax@DN876_c0_g1_i2.p1